MKWVNISIDGTQLQAREGTRLLPAALAAGFRIPYGCYVPGLEPPVVECKLCVVEVDGHMVNACNQPVTEGMMVTTSNPELERYRRQRLHFPG